MKIAVDFDGTIVEHAYPEIGREKSHAFQTLKALQYAGCELILWTCRTGPELEEALKFCRKHGIEFYAVNKSGPEEAAGPLTSRKIDADLYIDDKILGGFPGWDKVLQALKSNLPEETHPSSLLSRLKSLAGF